VLSVSAQHEFVETSDFVICDATEHVGQPSLRIAAVQFGCLDKRTPTPHGDQR